MRAEAAGLRRLRLASFSLFSSAMADRPAWSGAHDVVLAPWAWRAARPEPHEAGGLRRRTASVRPSGDPRESPQRGRLDAPRRVVGSDPARASGRPAGPTVPQGS